MGTNIAINNGLIISSNNRREVIPKSIRDAMVLWYDIKRQKATNETMSANPILKDLSGNGHDAICNGFDWNEKSGIYSNALVTDGKDDHATATGLPLLTKDKGFTVIAKRKIFEDNMGCTASKRDSYEINGAFLLELFAQNRVDSFNGKNTTTFNLERELTYMTSTSYNGETIKIGTGVDKPVLNIGMAYASYFAKIALYSFLLFNRDLTLQEIEWVKKNLIEGDKYSIK